MSHRYCINDNDHVRLVAGMEPSMYIINILVTVHLNDHIIHNCHNK